MLRLEELTPTGMLFRFGIELRYDKRAGTPQWCLGPDACQAYRFPAVEAMTRSRRFAEWWGAWSEGGLSFSCAVRKRLSPLWCRPTRVDSSDRVELYLNMRPWASIRRPAEYCIRVCVLPEGGGSQANRPFVISGSYRATKYEQKSDNVAVRVDRQGYDYQLYLSLNADYLSFFQPEYAPNVGFTYCIYDHTLGVQTFGGLPAEGLGMCPDLWGVLNLVR